jgi:ribonuclease-3
MNPPRQELLTRLDYTFNDEQLFVQALTHRSMGGKHNERLEFLGDSILNFVIAYELYKKFPRATEGELSRSRASLVKEDTLAEIALELQLGDHLLLGSGELKSGGFRRKSILSDTVEAIIASIYLDGGQEAAETLILHLYRQRLDKFVVTENLKDPKSQLQELLQSRQVPLPEYRVISIEGAAHDQHFKVECHVQGLVDPSLGDGNSRRKAEQAAAQKALPRVKKVLNV